MKKILLLISLPLFVFTSLLHAQIKGQPVFHGPAPGQTSLPKDSSRLSPQLQDLYQRSGPRVKMVQSVKPPAQQNDFIANYLQIHGNQVVVDITVNGDISAAGAALKKLGFQEKAAFGRILSGLIPINSLPQLDNTRLIQYARPAYKPLHQGGSISYRPCYSKTTVLSSTDSRLQQQRAADPGHDNSKAIQPVISQGDTAQRSYIARNKYHVNGKGVKIGILSDSYDNLHGAATGITHGELPGPHNPFHYDKPVQVLEDLDSGGTDEGRAMMEIAHDVAPGAQLAFHTANNGVADFAQGILALADAGCKVIADDIIYFNEPFFQDGIIAQAVDKVKSRGVTYFSAAGNEGLRSYASDYRPTDISPLGSLYGTAHNFSGAGATPQYYQPLYIPPGGSLIASLQWDESSFSASGVGCQTDMDAYLFNVNGELVASANTNNILSGDPIELFGYLNETSDPTFYLVILKFAGPDPAHLKYILYNDAQFYITNPAIPGILSNTLVGHAKAEGAIATAAAAYYNTPAYGVDPPLAEPFNSEGGVPNYYDTAGNRIPPLIRLKPEIVAPDGVNTSFFNPFGNGDIPQDTDTFPNFFGTSAAAPHAAGIAALMLEAERIHTLTPDQIKGVLTSHAIDMDDPTTPGFDKGFDFATGYGLVQADKAVGIVDFPNSYIKDLRLSPLCSSAPATSRNFSISNPNPFPVAVNWQIFGSNQRGSILAPPGDTSFSATPYYYYRTPFPTIALLNWEDNFGFTHRALSGSSTALCGREQVSNSNTDKIQEGAGFSPSPLPSDPANGQTRQANVYPNPASDVLHLYLSLPADAPVSIRLYNADGRQLQNHESNTYSGLTDIGIAGYPPGIYLLVVKQADWEKTIKIIKQ